jgi:hypothetical protein
MHTDRLCPHHHTYIFAHILVGLVLQLPPLVTTTSPATLAGVAARVPSSPIRKCVHIRTLTRSIHTSPRTHLRRCHRRCPRAAEAHSAVAAKLAASERALVDAETRADELAKQHGVVLAASDREKAALKRQFEELHEDKLLAERASRFAADDAASHEGALDRERKRFTEALEAQRIEFETAMRDQREE